MYGSRSTSNSDWSESSRKISYEASPTLSVPRASAMPRFNQTRSVRWIDHHGPELARDGDLDRLDLLRGPDLVVDRAAGQEHEVARFEAPGLAAPARTSVPTRSRRPARMPVSVSLLAIRTSRLFSGLQQASSHPMRILTVLSLLAALFPATAFGSAIIGDRNVRNPTLAVNKQGIALVRYTTEQPASAHVLAWGAVNATRASGRPRRRRSRNSSSTTRAAGRARRTRDLLEDVQERVHALHGPGAAVLRRRLHGARRELLGAAELAAQPADRRLRRRGRPAQKAFELHLSHWSGPAAGARDLPALDVRRHAQGFFGRLTYQGQPVFGTRSASASVERPFARNIYIDVFDSDYGPGGSTTRDQHAPGNGGFCYTFVPQAPPAGYPAGGAARQRPGRAHTASTRSGRA